MVSRSKTNLYLLQLFKIATIVHILCLIANLTIHPYISPDNELAFFTRRFELTEKGMLTSQNVEKFMIARLQQDGNYDKGKPMDDPFNRGTSNNEGGAAITIDNKHLFFTVNTKGNFDICTSDFIANASVVCT